MSKSNLIDLWSSYVDRTGKMFLDLDENNNLLIIDSHNRKELVRIDKRVHDNVIVGLLESLGFDKKS